MHLTGTQHTSTGILTKVQPPWNVYTRIQMCTQWNNDPFASFCVFSWKLVLEKGIHSRENVVRVQRCLYSMEHKRTQWWIQRKEILSRPKSAWLCRKFKPSPVFSAIVGQSDPIPHEPPPSTTNNLERCALLDEEDPCAKRHFWGAISAVGGKRYTGYRCQEIDYLPSRKMGVHCPTRFCWDNPPPNTLCGLLGDHILARGYIWPHSTGLNYGSSTDSVAHRSCFFHILSTFSLYPSSSGSTNTMTQHNTHVIVSTVKARLERFDDGILRQGAGQVNQVLYLSVHSAVWRTVRVSYVWKHKIKQRINELKVMFKQEALTSVQAARSSRFQWTWGGGVHHDNNQPRD